MRLARPSTERSARVPRLLLLVFGIFLMLVGIAGSALVAVTSSHVAETTLAAVVDRDRSLVDFFANESLRIADVEVPLRPARRAEIEDRLGALARSDRILAIEVVGAGGRSVVGTVGSGPAAVDPARIDDALAGTPFADLVEVGSTTVVIEYLPLETEDGRVLGAIILERDADEVMAALDAARRDVLLVTLVTAVVLAGILVAVFRAAHERLVRQQRQLADAARRDALTGLLNHGSIVALLAERVEASRAAATPTAVALVDVDNFRLFNDAHGHEAGDAVLLQVAELVTASAGPDGHAARYGPDEFIVVHEGCDADALRATMVELQERVRELSTRVGDSEELPVSVSVGIAAVPVNATSVTPLLSEASVALGEAKASGGDALVVARIGEDGLRQPAGFDVLQGLVLAVDTKDRYTKRHSEDVARYGVWLARRTGLEGDALETVRLAGLLHDVGKIGIPDGLLRKPSRLTEAEVRVFNQHVALGDAIVGALKGFDEVRAGIRHHHERWDGGGYLGGLAGEDIPLVARIIAVADTFSAMTTTRPYRKALPVDEALRRLTEAAGTQLQPELVEAFVSGMESDPDAPAPNEASDVWVPLRVA